MYELLKVSVTVQVCLLSLNVCLQLAKMINICISHNPEQQRAQLRSNVPHEAKLSKQEKLNNPSVVQTNANLKTCSKATNQEHNGGFVAKRFKQLHLHQKL